MKTAELFRKKVVFSFEVFPPKRSAAVDTIYSTLDALKDLNPDFISVTYGASGSDNCQATLEIASAIKKDYAIESVAHLPCISLSKEQALLQLESFRKAGIENILALRGDLPVSGAMHSDFQYASDLISLIKETGDFNVIAACYPEGHKESGDMIRDIRNLKTKVDTGADQLITQLFFDNDYFYRFRERACLAGIDIPIEAGIMPVVNKKQIERMATLCGVNLPKKFVTMMERYENSPEAMRDAGIAYAVDQIVDLITQGADGIHLYTMNNPYIAQKIYEAVCRLITA
ncbi:MAG: methylenetetrahydrofolate reductase [NAD(P)H] [Clostridia bacterium]|nr:methylenetetrahydrofolate reductase [NAD(P)H] [Clostridia bacterium]